MTFITTALAWLAEHVDLLEVIYDAIVNRGVQKADLIKAVQAEMVAAANKQMQLELG